jgi:AbrB family looped-hinge helix DNA binding protein
LETTRLSTKGQIILPKSIRESREWGPGTEFVVEERPEGILLRPTPGVPETKLEDVAGFLKYRGKPKTIAQMDEGIRKMVIRRRDRGRY